VAEFMGENTITGADCIVKALNDKEIQLVFAITGAGNLAIIDAILRDGKIKLIYSHHEQAAVMEAQGYSRISGKIGVALVTTGGGTSNAITGILSAHLDSVPVLVISGNESSFHCENRQQLRAYGVQGFDSVSVIKPIAKDSHRITDASEIIKVTHNMIDLALTPRMGPTHIDFPMDLQRKNVAKNVLPPIKNSSAVNPIGNLELYNFLNSCLENLMDSSQPMLYIGNGCRDVKIIKLLEMIIENLQIPFLLSWSAIDMFPENHPLNMGRVGIYGDRAANIALQKTDLLICLGTRLAIPQVGYELADFARNATKWVVEIDPTECDKFSGSLWNVLNGDVSEFLTAFNLKLKIQDLRVSPNWVIDLETIWSKIPRKDQIGDPVSDPELFVHSAEIIQYLNKQLKEDSIIATDVGAGLLTGHYMFEAKGSQRFFTSQGLGEMGFGLPGAIGAYFAEPTKQIICLNTDGGIMFNLQELQLVCEHRIPLKLFVFNNNGYTMIKTSQENLFESRISGSTSKTGISFPPLISIAETFGFDYYKVLNNNSLNKQFDNLLDSQKPVLFEIIMDPEQKYLPRLATTKLKDGSLVSPPLEDLSPMISAELLRSLLGQDLRPESIKARE
jgi:acetolactate synthase-1/2/3 large subunit